MADGAGIEPACAVMTHPLSRRDLYRLGESIHRRVPDSNRQFHLRSRISNAVRYHSAQLSNAPGISSRQLDGRFRVPIESNYLSWFTLNGRGEGTRTLKLQDENLVTITSLSTPPLNGSSTQNRTGLS